MFPGPPTMGSRGKAPDDLRLSHNVQTPTLNLNSDEIAAIPNLSTATTVRVGYHFLVFSTYLACTWRSNAREERSRFISHFTRATYKTSALKDSLYA